MQDFRRMRRWRADRLVEACRAPALESTRQCVQWPSTAMATSSGRPSRSKRTSLSCPGPDSSIRPAHPTCVYLCMDGAPVGSKVNQQARARRVGVGTAPPCVVLLPSGAGAASGRGAAQFHVAGLQVDAMAAVAQCPLSLHRPNTGVRCSSPELDAARHACQLPLSTFHTASGTDLAMIVSLALSLLGEYARSAFGRK